MINKKGISDVVTTVLIILLVVAAVAIIWAFIQRPLQQGGQALQSGADCLQVSVTPVTCAKYVEGTRNIANATYKWVAGSATLSGVKVIYQLVDGTTSIVSGTAPSGVGSSEKAIYNGTIANSATIISTAAIIKGTDGKDVTCAESLEKIVCTQT